jgi:hypothetical protein
VEYSVTGAVMSPCPVDDAAGSRGENLYRWAQQTQERSQVLVDQAKRIHAALESSRAPASRQQQLERSAYARLLARLETMPVIEQAKGILMAQSHCDAAEAFDMLRQASQRTNVPVRDIAARIVTATTHEAPPEKVRGAPRPRTPAAGS